MLDWYWSLVTLVVGAGGGAFGMYKYAAKIKAKLDEAKKELADALQAGAKKIGG